MEKKSYNLSQVGWDEISAILEHWAKNSGPERYLASASSLSRRIVIEWLMVDALRKSVGRRSAAVSIAISIR